MARLAEVLGGVLVNAGITAADVTAGEAHPQVSPVLDTQFGALFAYSGRARLGLGDVGREMLTHLGWPRRRLARTPSLHHAVQE
jgi:hypothetical protein